jgi:hypothetical protein
VRPHPGGPTSQPPLRGRFLGGPRPLPRRCSSQVWRVGGLSPSLIFSCANLLYALPDCAFCLVFHLYSNVCPTIHVFSNTSGTRSIVYACVISLFISPVLDFNWRSDLIDSDRQQLLLRVTVRIRPSERGSKHEHELEEGS